MSRALYIGLISGTSADGIDAVLVRFAPALQVLAALSLPYPHDLRARLLDLAQAPAPVLSLDELGHLDARLGEAFAEAALAVLQAAGAGAAQVAAIGSHGQTLRHRPDPPHAFSLQLGDPARIAERTGITTVADFRRRDIAAGGQGAPLMPAFHAAFLADAREPRAVLNLGGIANLTLLPVRGAVTGFDTGPGNALLDAWIERQRGERFDRDGDYARSGTVDAALLQRLLADPWFAAPPPKSTGREVFHLHWLQAGLAGAPAAADVQATLLELTAASVAVQLRARQPDTARLLVCGGGVHNRALMARLDAHLAPIGVESTAVHGLDPDHVEATGFAWLAQRTLAGEAGNLPAVTGAAGARVLGAIHHA
ncbi:MAG TPA: anhydro-N-acetylmuramic acid kinase [Xanthomonadaceae bacterium]|nr:anhydro-N-acetylmuramic acid kinase [Xanthomonadaceae bacterium]